MTNGADLFWSDNHVMANVVYDALQEDGWVTCGKWPPVGPEDLAHAGGVIIMLMINASYVTGKL